jgi:PST family polysaccharide transporter
MAAVREIFPFGAGVHAKRLLDYAATNVDNLVVGRFLGMTTLGLYDKAFSTVGRVLSRMNVGGPTVVFRIFSMIHEDPERFRRAYRKTIMSATLLAFPVFAALITSAPHLIVVLYGARWSPAALPFQFLALAGCLKVLNAYVSSAIQATGWIWSQVWRQAIYVAMIVIGVYAFRGFGAGGAAFGVLLATLGITVLIHALLVRVTPLSVRDIFGAQVPGLLCAGWVAAVDLGIAYAMSLVRSAPGEWLLVALQLAAAAIAFVLFVLFAPHEELRLLACEMAEDLAPPFVKRHRFVRWWLNTPSPTGASALT